MKTLQRLSLNRILVDTQIPIVVVTEHAPGTWNRLVKSVYKLKGEHDDGFIYERV